MAKDSIDDILVRLDEIEKLQTELRHLVPRATSNSSRNARHQDLSRETSIRFPSLFTFPVISNLTSSSSKNERVQKSVAQLNLNDKLSKDNRSSTVNLKSARESSHRESSTRETNIFKNLLRGTDKSLARSHAGNSLASTSVGNSKASMKDIVANRVFKNSQDVIRKELKGRTTETVSKDKPQCITNERSNMQLSEIRSSVQTSDVQIHVAEIAKSRDVRSCLRRRRNKKEMSIKTLIQRIMEKFNYCFVDNNRVTIPHHYPGSKNPKRVQKIKTY